MPASDGTEPIGDYELLYRRVTVKSGWYDSTKACPVAPEAFTPKRHDTTGISLWRAGYKTAEQAATAFGEVGKRYYVVVLRAIDLRQHGIEVVPTPHEGGPGHATIPVLHYADRRSQEAKELSRLLAMRLSHRVEGPFSPTGPASAPARGGPLGYRPDDPQITRPTD
jgi:hypothetical protein